MNEQFLIFLAIIVLVVVYKQFRAKRAIAVLSELSRDEIQLLDVRSESEFAGFNVPGSLNIPVQMLLAGKTAKLEQTKTVVVYCASGMRSATAATWLKKKGFNVVDAGTVGNVMRGVQA